jgi:hypothetical protein
MKLQLYKGPWIYDLNDKSVPASVRLRNPGAIGRTRDGHEFRFGAIDSATLPASDGSQLPTPAFETVYGGAAYWGHYVVRRAETKPGVTSIASIMKAYSTGHSEAYGNTVARETGISLYEAVDLWRDPEGYHKAYEILISMSKWEAGARSSSAPGYEAYHLVYNLSDQAVIDELYWGMVHGMREAWRDKGYNIEVTPEEMTYVAPVVETPPPTPVEEDAVKGSNEDDGKKDPLIDGPAGWRTVITGALGILATFFATIFDLLGFENAEKLGGVAAQVMIGLALLFLILKFWKRFERLLKRSAKTLG